MIKEKHGAVIGYKNPITWELGLSSNKNASILANHSANNMPLYTKSRNFRQMTV